MNVGTASAGRRASAPARPRAFRHAAVTSAAVVVVCATIAVLSALSYQDETAHLAALSARSVGRVTGGNGTSVDVAWEHFHAVVQLAGAAPQAGTRTEIAYDPADPTDAIIPGARLLADADESRGGLIFAALVAFLVLAIDAIWLLRRIRPARRPGRPLTVRRIRVQRRLLSRSWLETEPTPGTRQRWIPIYYDPVLAELPSPVEVTVHGDLRLDRLVAIEANGVRLYPSGRVTATEPAGRRTDSPARPDEYAIARAHRTGLARQLRVDVALTVPAPLLGLFWSYLDQGGVPSWLGATALCATFGLWLVAIRGSDPT